jgi:GH35 family endo-1,4-beta-xylanase
MANEFKKLIVSTPENDKRIQDGIEKNRKGNFSLKVAEGKVGGKIRVRLKNHKFKFGANLFMLDEFPDDSQKNQIYRDTFKDVFNLATLPFYWSATEPEEGKTRYHKDAEKLYRRPPIDLCLEYCFENGIEPREHALCYTNLYPKWIENKTFEDFKVYMERRMQEISTRYADKISTIEVTNEMFSKLDKHANYYYHNDYIEYCFKLAEQYFPNNRLGINEETCIWRGNATNRDGYFGYIRDTLLRGCRVDLIGMQYHMFYRQDEYYNEPHYEYDTTRLYNILDKYAEFGKPIEITEITIPAFAIQEDKEEEQADIIEKLYSLWFSHPSVENIIYWNLVDGYAAYTTPGNMTAGENYYHGGLLRFDMTEKPAFKRLKKLIKEVWTTDETLTLDENGTAQFRGFFGDYEVVLESESGGRVIEAKFYKNNDSVEIK